MTRNSDSARNRSVGAVVVVPPASVASGFPPRSSATPPDADTAYAGSGPPSPEGRIPIMNTAAAAAATPSPPTVRTKDFRDRSARLAPQAERILTPAMDVLGRLRLRRLRPGPLLPLLGLRQNDLVRDSCPRRLRKQWRRIGREACDFLLVFTSDGPNRVDKAVHVLVIILSSPAGHVWGAPLTIRRLVAFSDMAAVPASAARARMVRCRRVFH